MSRTDEPTLDLGLDPDLVADPFPWPMPTEDTPEASSSWGLSSAQTWPDLTPAERGCALFVGDGLCGPGSLPSLTKALGIPEEQAVELLWGLLRKGYLQAVAGWWAW